MAAAILPNTESVPCCIRVINVMIIPPRNASVTVSVDIERSRIGRLTRSSGYAVWGTS